MDLERRLRESDALHAAVERLLAAAARETTARAAAELAMDIERVGIAIARFQAACVAPLGRLYAAKGMAPEDIDGLDRVVPLPADVLRMRRVAVHPPALDARCFRTSGTSRGRGARGEHPLRLTRTAAAAALAWAERMLWPDSPPRRLVLLCAPEPLAPDSSLSFMLARFAERLAPAATSWHFDNERLDAKGVVHACASARAADEPVLVAGTSFAFAELVEQTREADLSLPAGSRLMPTGGFKGRRHELGASELRRALAERFALPASHLVGEYGMTELSSQLYEGTLVRSLGRGCPEAEPGRYYAPPWLRVRALDPIEHRALPPGETGLASFVDLANVDSSIGILTADLVRVHQDGGVELLGRASGAPARGCSLRIEEALGEDEGEAGAAADTGAAAPAPSRGTTDRDAEGT